MRALTEHQESQIEVILESVLKQNSDRDALFNQLRAFAEKAYSKLNKITYKKSDRWMESEKGDALLSCLEEWEWLISEIDVVIEIPDLKSSEILIQESNVCAYHLVIKTTNGESLNIHIPFIDLSY